MFITQVGTPAGYGYFKTSSTKALNIVPDMVKYLKEHDENYSGGSISISTLTIQVKTESMVSINGKSSIIIPMSESFTFDARGVTSIKFDADGVMYNIIATY